MFIAQRRLKHKFLTNISYNRVKDVDLTNDSFIIDCYTFILFYLNSFYLEQKFEDGQRKS